MIEVIEYGVFKVGRRWRVTTVSGVEFDFDHYEDAFAAALALVDAQRASGLSARFVIQDEAGQLVTSKAPS